MMFTLDAHLQSNLWDRNMCNHNTINSYIELDTNAVEEEEELHERHSEPEMTNYIAVIM